MTRENVDEVREEPSWVAALRLATRGKAQPGIEVAHGRAPALLAADAVEALTSTLLAALVIAAATLRSDLSEGRFDLIALLLRSAAVAFVVRASIAQVRLARRLVRQRSATRAVLAWSAQGMYESVDGQQRWVAREEVVALALPEERVVRGASVSLKPLYLVLRSQREPRHWQLAPYYAERAEILQARLARWLGPQGGGEAEHEPPTSAPEERYLRAAAGQLGVDELIVPEGRGYLLRAPYAVLLALVFVADAVRMAGAERARVLPAALLAALLAPCALIAWFVWLRSRRSSRLGLALLLTPEELLVRGRHGVLSLPWTQLAQVEVATRLAWSPFVGGFLVRTLLLSALDGTTVQLDGSFLGTPPEVVAALAKVYREGRYRGGPAGGTAASHGSGGGGGSSAREGTTTSARSHSSPSARSESDRAAAALGRSSES